MLSPTEQEVSRGLKERRWGINRLEQERIPWSFAAPRLRRAITELRPAPERT